ncbi:MAG: putative phosphothreonine lyase domain-containing protein [Candidatus Nanohaloarchaea archaeon]
MDDELCLSRVHRNAGGESFIELEHALKPTEEFRADFIWIDSPTYTDGSSIWETGKWVLKLEEEIIDRAHEKVSEMVETGALGSAKTSTLKSSGARDSYIVCVYNDNFQDVNTIETAGKLLDSMIEPAEMGYKPDFFTRLGVYPESLDEFGLDSEYIYTLEEGEL